MFFLEGSTRENFFPCHIHDGISVKIWKNTHFLQPSKSDLNKKAVEIS